MNKTPTTLIIMDGFGLGAGDRRQRRRRRPRRPVLDQLFKRVRPHHAVAPPGWTWVCPTARWATARWATPTSARGRVVYPGSAPHHQAPSRTAASFENPGATARHGRLPASTAPRLHLMRPAVRRRRPLPHRAPVRPAARWPSSKGLKKVYIHALPGRAGRVPHLRHGLRAGAVGKLRRARRGQDRHGDGPLLRHGPRQALGARGEGL